MGWRPGDGTDSHSRKWLAAGREMCVRMSQTYSRYLVDVYPSIMGMWHVT